jgi:hypothetical protein
MQWRNQDRALGGALPLLLLPRTLHHTLFVQKTTVGESPPPPHRWLRHYMHASYDVLRPFPHWDLYQYIFSSGRTTPITKRNTSR